MAGVVGAGGASVVDADDADDGDVVAVEAVVDADESPADVGTESASDVGLEEGWVWSPCCSSWLSSA